ncbi:unnamed protein product, partial [Oikopleura dioica]
MAHKSKYYKELDDGVLDLSMQNLKVFSKLSELDLSGNALCELPNQISKCSLISKLILEGNAITNLPEDFVELKRLFHLDLRGNPLSPHLQNAAGDCQSKSVRRECELAAARVMKFQAVYQLKCIKVRKESEAKKRKEENRA